MKAAAESPRSNAYKDLLAALERGETPTKKMLDDAFKVVNGKFLESYRAAGNEAVAVHHWNYSRNDFPNQVFDPRNLVPVPNKATHEAIHRATTSNPAKIWEAPTDPQHVIPIPRIETPLAPPPPKVP